MIAQGNAKAGSAEQNEKQDYLKPIDAEVPQVDRNGGDGKDERSDKERARYPINAMEWNARKHAAYYLQSARQNNVFFRPVMNLLAVGAGKLRCFHLGSVPELFVDCLASRRQFGRSGAANK
jgi:hypothetical protein